MRILNFLCKYLSIGVVGSFCVNSTLSAAIIDADYSLMNESHYFLEYDNQLDQFSRQLAPSFRDYFVPLKPSEAELIRGIVVPMAYDSLPSLASKRSEIKKKGKKVNHLHPFRFLEAIFTDEEMKAAVHAIRDRIRWIWDGFLDGVKGSLTEEEAKGNVKPEHIQDFAQRVQIDVNLIIPPIQEHRWEDFVNILVDTIPRNTETRRYNM